MQRRITVAPSTPSYIVCLFLSNLHPYISQKKEPDGSGTKEIPGSVVFHSLGGQIVAPVSKHSPAKLNIGPNVIVNGPFLLAQSLSMGLRR